MRVGVFVKLCKECNRPLTSAKSIEEGIGTECKRKLKHEVEMENQLLLRLGKEVPKELKVKKGVCTKLRYKGHEYALIHPSMGV